MTIENTILEKVRVLSPEKQQQVLTFINFLETDEWELLYKGKFQELQQEIQIGIAAANRGEFVDAEEVFQSLRNKLQAKRAQAGQ
ncbi:hypothetical protein A0J48_023170 [Sphaerospermopsis aphanizomenoides BCCUSP55]|uniref:hypothetical protein n=1 Tax=Sphaerospermopsis aphanizomenoides TaxID=459663 RepID=UPI0019080C71|nr:hypothetical protein [Sphaerospermopsis aphanizomenoides]MBK1990388.1 hypothetical protein [Sphaerospermopsis aphanizomenoides BCCUSP55]